MNTDFKTRIIGGLKKAMQPVPAKVEKGSYSKPYIDKSYNIMGRVNAMGIQLVSSFKVVEKGSTQIVDTPKGKEQVTADYGDVLLTDPSGKKSLVSVGDVAQNYFMDNLSKRALVAVAQDALENNKAEYSDYDASNTLYEIKNQTYVTTKPIMAKIAGLVDESKDRTEVSGRDRRTDTIHTIL